MSDASWSRELDLIRRGGASLAPGLAPAEFAAVEERFGFQFPPDRRSLLAAGNPVLSVWQTDIIYCGRDLRSYLANEFAGAKDFPRHNRQVRGIRFWSELVDVAP